MGNANSASGGVRDRHKSGDSLPPSSPCGVMKDGQAFSFEKRVSVGSSGGGGHSGHHHSSSTSSSQPHYNCSPAPSSVPSSPAPSMNIVVPSSSSSVVGYNLNNSSSSSSGAKKIIQLQQSHDDDDPSSYNFPHHQSNNNSSSKSKSILLKDLSTEEYPEIGRPRAVTMSEGTKYGEHGSKILPTVFKWDGGGKVAFICGTFSDWKTIPMAKSNFSSTSDYVAIVDLPEGEHQYKFLIDGEWKHNPSEPIVETENGTVNNVITVKKTDFEVFDALAMDSVNSQSKTQLISGSPPGSEWAQDIPSYKPWEKTTGPPILPPHLLQVILNKDTPLSCEPTLLPEPNHVMLNHLYALSIKDGVMVLSATHRYRKKYVTTLLYKPI